MPRAHRQPEDFPEDLLNRVSRDVVRSRDQHRCPPSSDTLTVMTLPAPIDLLHRGVDEERRLLSGRDRRRHRPLRLRADTVSPCSEARPRRARPRARRYSASPAVSHPLRPRGSTGALVRESPSLQVHVSEIGAPHLVDPSRLEASARRLYGDTFDALWGELVPVPETNIRIVGSRVVGLECFPSTGHASHHVSMLHDDGTLYAGDSAGVRIAPARFVLAPTPPPDIDLEAWERTITATSSEARSGSPSPISACSTTSSRTSLACVRRCNAGANGSRTGWTRQPSSRPLTQTALPRIPRQARIRPRRAVLPVLPRARSTGASDGNRRRRSHPSPERRAGGRTTYSRSDMDRVDRVSLAAYACLYPDARRFGT